MIVRNAAPELAIIARGAGAHDLVRWGIVGCGNVTEVKSGPGFQKAEGSALPPVMRRDRAKAADYARRHGVPRVHADAEALIDDAGVDASTSPHHPQATLISRCACGARKPCLVEKPMAMTHAECARMIEAFRAAGVPLFVAYYRRRSRFSRGAAAAGIGRHRPVTDVHVRIAEPLAKGDARPAGGSNPAIAGAGSSMTSLALSGPARFPARADRGGLGFRREHGGAYAVEDVTAGSFRFSRGLVGTGVWNFNADRSEDTMVFSGPLGELRTPVFTDGDVIVRRGGHDEVLPLRNPPHVHQPLIQPSSTSSAAAAGANRQGRAAPARRG